MLHYFRTSSAKKNASQKYLEKDDDNSDCEESSVTNSHDVKKPVPSAPKDPYEFTDIDETAPSEKGFRPIADSFSKVSGTF